MTSKVLLAILNELIHSNSSSKTKDSNCMYSIVNRNNTNIYILVDLQSLRLTVSQMCENITQMSTSIRGMVDRMTVIEKEIHETIPSLIKNEITESNNRIIDKINTMQEQSKEDIISGLKNSLQEVSKYNNNTNILN